MVAVVLYLFTHLSDRIDTIMNLQDPFGPLCTLKIWHGLLPGTKKVGMNDMNGDGTSLSMIVVTNCLCLSWFPELSPKVPRCLLAQHSAVSRIAGSARPGKPWKSWRPSIRCLSYRWLLEVVTGIHFLAGQKRWRNHTCPEARKTIKQCFYV